MNIMQKLSNLTPNRRYTFYKLKQNKTESCIITKFNADFVNIIHNTLRIKNYIDETGKITEGIVTMPLDWIITAEETDTLKHIIEPDLIITDMDDYYMEQEEKHK